MVDIVKLKALSFDLSVRLGIQILFLLLNPLRSSWRKRVNLLSIVIQSLRRNKNWHKGFFFPRRISKLRGSNLNGWWWLSCIFFISNDFLWISYGLFNLGLVWVECKLFSITLGVFFSFSLNFIFLTFLVNFEIALSLFFDGVRLHLYYLRWESISLRFHSFLKRLILSFIWVDESLLILINLWCVHGKLGFVSVWSLILNIK